ncbi:hypothetical protein KCU65_g8086, partial [Aureobasidium melanogenum]
MDRTITRHAHRLTQFRPTSLPRTLYKPTSQHLRHRSNDSKNDNQVYPLTGYYADILSSRKTLKEELQETPTQKVQPQTHTAPTPPPPESLPKTDKEETLQKARIVFGSRLSGPSERKDEISANSKEIAGISVPPKPKEPDGDDCCMSGCVNCVWDIYREEFEEWRAKTKEAREKMEAQRAQRAPQQPQKVDIPAEMARSMDDDGGGSEALWTEGSNLDEEEMDPFANVPVGMREFMRTEKMLKQKRAEKGSKGGFMDIRST